jgi:hypothetical protein
VKYYDAIKKFAEEWEARGEGYTGEWASVGESVVIGGWTMNSGEA